MPPTASPAQHDRKLPSVQVLRGIAASLVVLYHFSASVALCHVNRSWIAESGLGETAKCGVDIFFVISGFIMAFTTRDKAGASDAGMFLLRRIVRIYPLYWVWTSVMLLLAAAGLVYRSAHFSFAYIASSYLLYPLFTKSTSRPILGQGWTLWFEMLFYLVFACGVWARVRRHRLLFLGASFSVLAVAAHLVLIPPGLKYLFSQTLIVEFLFGVLIAEILSRLPKNCDSRWMPNLAICAGIVLLFCTSIVAVTDSTRVVYYGIPSFFIVSGAAMRGTQPAPRWLIYLGDASYSIYLVHGFSAAVFFYALKRRIIFDRFPGDAEIVILGAITIYRRCRILSLKST
jgi:peptidoglycan/LPS O-acetylase OafA/YrhL